MEKICAEGIPQELLTASINSLEFQVTERPGNLPDGVMAAIEAVTGWLHTGDPMADLRVEEIFAFLREKVGTDWYTGLLAQLLEADPVEVTLVPQKPQPEDGPSARQEGKLQLDHPLTVADLGRTAPLPGCGGRTAGRPDSGHPAHGGQPVPEFLLRYGRPGPRGGQRCRPAAQPAG